MDLEKLIAKWYAGDTIKTIAMSDFGEEYERKTHKVSMELLGYLVQTQPNLEDVQLPYQIIDWAFQNFAIASLDPSETMYNKALQLALNYYEKGYNGVLEDIEVLDRHTELHIGHNDNQNGGNYA